MLQVPEKLVRFVQERSGDGHVVDLLIWNGLDRPAVKAVDRRVRKRHQHGGVRRNNELRLLLFDHQLDQRQQGQLSHRRERRLGLVHEV